MTDELKCKHCDLHCVKLKYGFCRFCEKEWEAGKITRRKVKHDYVGARNYLIEVYKKIGRKCPAISLA